MPQRKKRLTQAELGEMGVTPGRLLREALLEMWWERANRKAHKGSGYSPLLLPPPTTGGRVAVNGPMPRN